MMQRMGPVILVTSALAVVAGLVLFFVGSAAPATPVSTVTPIVAAPGATGFLRDPSRSSLRVCVDAIGGSQGGPDATQAFADGIENLRQELSRARYAQLLLDQLAAVAVTRGCPPAVALDESKHFPDPKTGDLTVIGPIVDTPSQYLIHAYIVSSETFRKWFGNRAYATATEEVFCGLPRSLNCAGVTSGLYFNSKPSSEVIAEALRVAFGLRL